MARPYNADVGKNILRRPEETLVINVVTDKTRNTINYYILGHTSTIRKHFRQRAENFEGEFDIEFALADEPVSLKPVEYKSMGMSIYDGSESVAFVGFNPPILSQ